MAYEFVITVPPNRQEENPVVQEIKLPPQVITYVEVEMAAGTHRMVKCAIYRGKYKLYPRNQEGSLATDGHVIPIPTFFKLTRNRSTLEIRCWSPNTIYSHDVTVRFILLPEEIASNEELTAQIKALKEGLGIF